MASPDSDSRSRPPDDADSFAWLLAATAVGSYALIVAGATTAVADAARACPTWPACNGRWLALDSAAHVVVWGHRLAAVLVGALVLLVAALAWRRGDRRRVRIALVVAVLLYPVQVGLGAVSATGGTPDLVSAIHLAIGMTIFAAVLLALAWSLEATTGAAGRSAERPTPATGGTSRHAGAGRSGKVDGLLLGSGPLATAYAYFRLTKPRLMWLLCLVAAAGMALAAGPELGVRTVVLTLGGGVLAIGASGTFNHVLERDVDREMARTADRPVATDRVPTRHAIAFGAALAVAAIATFLQVNALAAVLGVSAIVFYTVVYTLLLKPNTVQNTVLGGFAGAIPALIGWAAVTGRIDVPALALAGVIFLWTPAHFYNLALAYKEDYERGGFPMLPVVRGEAVTRKHVLLYLGATLLAAAALTAVTSLGLLYAATTACFGAAFLWAAVRLHRERTRAAAFRAFHASNAYLGALLLAIVVDALALT